MTVEGGFEEMFRSTAEMRQDFEPAVLRAGLPLETHMCQKLVEAAMNEMEAKLKIAASKGRYGWWSASVCSIQQLAEFRDKAIKDQDHISVLNYTAMIAAREAIDKMRVQNVKQ